MMQNSQSHHLKEFKEKGGFGSLGCECDQGKQTANVQRPCRPVPRWNQSASLRKTHYAGNQSGEKLHSDSEQISACPVKTKATLLPNREINMISAPQWRVGLCVFLPFVRRVCVCVCVKSVSGAPRMLFWRSRHQAQSLSARPESCTRGRKHFNFSFSANQTGRGAGWCSAKAFGFLLVLSPRAEDGWRQMPSWEMSLLTGSILFEVNQRMSHRFLFFSF